MPSIIPRVVGHRARVVLRPLGPVAQRLGDPDARLDGDPQGLRRRAVAEVSAPTARVAMPYLAALSASKAALSSLSSAVRLELAPWHIPVIVVEPGLAGTEIFAKAEAAAAARSPSPRCRTYPEPTRGWPGCSPRCQPGCASGR
jgi:NAD(P)-dependent dehydrogenase (short-subunit alcohol dehydrogenase family)